MSIAKDFLSELRDLHPPLGPVWAPRGHRPLCLRGVSVNSHTITVSPWRDSGDSHVTECLPPAGSTPSHRGVGGWPLEDGYTPRQKHSGDGPRVRASDLTRSHLIFNVSKAEAGGGDSAASLQARPRWPGGDPPLWNLGLEGRVLRKKNRACTYPIGTQGP